MEQCRSVLRYGLCLHLIEQCVSEALQIDRVVLAECECRFSMHVQRRRSVKRAHFIASQFQLSFPVGFAPGARQHHNEKLSCCQSLCVWWWWWHALCSLFSVWFSRQTPALLKGKLSSYKPWASDWERILFLIYMIYYFLFILLLFPVQYQTTNRQLISPFAENYSSAASVTIHLKCVRSFL